MQNKTIVVAFGGYVIDITALRHCGQVDGRYWGKGNLGKMAQLITRVPPILVLSGGFIACHTIAQCLCDHRCADQTNGEGQ